MRKMRLGVILMAASALVTSLLPAAPAGATKYLHVIFIGEANIQHREIVDKTPDHLCGIVGCNVGKKESKGFDFKAGKDKMKKEKAPPMVEVPLMCEFVKETLPTKTTKGKPFIVPEMGQCNIHTKGSVEPIAPGAENVMCETAQGTFGGGAAGAGTLKIFLSTGTQTWNFTGIFAVAAGQGPIEGTITLKSTNQTGTFVGLIQVGFQEPLDLEACLNPPVSPDKGDGWTKDGKAQHFKVIGESLIVLLNM
jgi:hypothetical protein